MVSVLFVVYASLLFYTIHCSFISSEAYSSPSIVIGRFCSSFSTEASSNRDGTRTILDDYREAYYWMRMNTDEHAKFMSWWDYGYQMAGMGNRTVIVDNNTWNNTHIATVGRVALCRSASLAGLRVHRRTGLSHPPKPRRRLRSRYLRRFHRLQRRRHQQVPLDDPNRLRRLPRRRSRGQFLQCGPVPNRRRRHAHHAKLPSLPPLLLPLQRGASQLQPAARLRPQPSIHRRRISPFPRFPFRRSTST